MNENEEITVAALICIDNKCNNTVLKIPQVEIIKFQSAEPLKNPELGSFNMGMFSFGMGLVLMTYVLAYGLGQMIKFVR